MIQDAACSSLAKMFINLAKEKDIQVINIVRREEQVRHLQELGVEYVLNSEEENFDEKLEELIDLLQPHAFFDCIGGKTAQRIFLKMPLNSTMYISGILDQEAKLEFQCMDLFRKSLSIVCLTLVHFLTKVLTPEEKQTYHDWIVHDISDGGEIFGSNVVKTYPLTEIEAAVEASREYKSEGKVILKPFYEE